MAWRNTEHEWGSVSKALHWLLALVIIGSSIFVLHVNDSTWWFKSSPMIFITYIHWHKALGLIALLLILVRILWRVREPIPRTDDLTPFEQRWSHRTHLALYALMVIVPVTGWLASSFFGSPTKFFGLFTIPAITPKWKPGVAIFYWVHFSMAWALLVLVGAHAAAAFYHHFRKRDRVLRSMWWGRAPVVSKETSA